ncbi:hypothetical protein S83_065230, partial [Arachis hypogaea]
RVREGEPNTVTATAPSRHRWSSPSLEGLNVEFESKNKKLSEDLAAAKAKMVVAVGTSGKRQLGNARAPNSKTYKNSLLRKKVSTKPVLATINAVSLWQRAQTPPTTTHTHTLVELCHSLKNHDMKRDVKGPLNHLQPVAIICTQ